MIQKKHTKKTLAQKRNVKKRNVKPGIGDLSKIRNWNFESTA